jgi:hypothetical protein
LILEHRNRNYNNSTWLTKATTLPKVLTLPTLLVLSPKGASWGRWYRAEKKLAWPAFAVVLPQKRSAAVARRAQTRPNWGADSTSAAAISCVESPNTLHKISAKMAKTLGLDQNDENQSKNSRKEPKNNVVRSKWG